MLHREKFHLREDLIQKVIEAFRQYGIEVLPQPTGAILIDMDDLVFYEVAMEKREDDAYISGWAVYPASQVLFLNSTTITELDFFSALNLIRLYIQITNCYNVGIK